MTTGYLDALANLEGKVAAVVGGGGGLGASVSLALARAGVDLALLDRDAAALDQTCEQARGLGRAVVAAAADATDSAALDAFFDRLDGEYGRLDILVNVAGGTLQRPFLESTPEDWGQDIQRNYGYAIQSVHRGAALMKRSGRGGSIVNYTTIEAHRGAATFSVYAGAKAALANFSRALAVELGPFGIRVNTLAPDVTPSAGNQAARPPELRALSDGVAPEQWRQARAMYVPLAEPPTPDELARSVLFLVSDLSAGVTGTTLHVDGGTHAACGFLNWPHGGGYLPMPTAGALKALFPGE